MAVLIFDFDGTIADTLSAIVEITNRLAPEFGYRPTSPDRLKSLKHLNPDQLIQQSEIALFKIPFLLRRVKAELSAQISSIALFPGMAEALIDLRNQGHVLGIATSNSAANVEQFLQQHQIQDVFHFIHTGISILGKGKILKRLLVQYQLEAKHVLYVGDEIRDIEAAHTTGIWVAAVTWGFNSGDALMMKRPDFLIETPHMLINIANQINLASKS